MSGIKPDLHELKLRRPFADKETQLFGTAGHQLDTRLYMDFMRMEGEFNFLTMLPEASRKAVRDYWYRDAHKSVREYVYGSRIAFDRETDIPFTTADPRLELMQMPTIPASGTNVACTPSGETSVTLARPGTSRSVPCRTSYPL